jgi:hypothetical protein
MNSDEKKLLALRQKITESLRIQRDNSETVPYIDAGNILGDVCARQNHAIFARRGCGKTLLLHHSRSLSENDDEKLSSPNFFPANFHGITVCAL